MDCYAQTRHLWQSFDVQTPGGLNRALNSFRVLFAYHSGKIENENITYHDTCEIFENGKVTGFTGDARALFEQQNQRLCYDFLVPKIVIKEPLTVALVKEIHRALTAGTFDETRYIERGERPGEFKKHDYVTGVHEVGFPPGDVESAVIELLEEVDSKAINDFLTAAAYMHARFEFIHPFADGNGRVGRVMLNYYLMIHSEPPLIVHEEDRKAYYQALERYDAEEDISLLRDFLREQTVKSWAKAALAAAWMRSFSTPGRP